MRLFHSKMSEMPVFKKGQIKAETVPQPMPKEWYNNLKSEGYEYPSTKDYLKASELARPALKQAIPKKWAERATAIVEKTENWISNHPNIMNTAQNVIHLASPRHFWHNRQYQS